jgi:p-hydroxybenzoate 3-monooxygenase
MTHLLHRFPEAGAFGEKVQQAELEYLVSSRAARTSLAENYVGLPYQGRAQSLAALKGGTGSDV